MVPTSLTRPVPAGPARFDRRRLSVSIRSSRLAKGAFWATTGTAIARLLGVLSSILAARMLGKNAFGELGIVQSTVGLFGTLAGLGLGITATKYVAEWRETQTSRCGRVILLTLAGAVAGGLLGSLGLALGSSWLATHSLAAPGLGPLLEYASVLVLLTTIQTTYTGALAGFEAFRRIAFVNVLGGILGAPLVVIGAMYWGLSGAVWGLSFQALIGCVAGHLGLTKEAKRAGIDLSFHQLRHDLKSVRSEAGLLWRFSLPAFLSSILVGPVNWICNSLLVNQPHGYGQAALLSAANQWKNAVGFLPLMLSSVAVPMLANLHGKGRHSDFLALLNRQVLLNTGLCFAFALPLAVFGHATMRCYGPDFVDGVPVLVLTLATTVVAAVNNLLSKSMQSAGRAWLDLGFSGIWASVLLVSSVLFIPRYKALGVAIAQILAAAILAAWQWQVLRRMLRSGKLSAAAAGQPRLDS